jgi:predicted Mrr-cat superfamily restriction endonuclease
LVDFSQMTEMKVTSEVVRQMVEINRKTAQLAPGVWVAIVAPSPLAYGMSRVWHSFAYDLDWTANVFHARPEAVAWLIKQLGKDDPDGKVLEQFPSLKVEEDETARLPIG